MARGRAAEIGSSELAVSRSRQWIGTCGLSHHSSQVWQGIMISELHQLARPGRCLIVYHHHTRGAGGHHAEMQHWADRLRASGFAIVDALRARPFSPRVYFLLDAPAVIRQRAERIALHWRNSITWHPGGDAHIRVREMRRARLNRTMAFRRLNQSSHQRHSSRHSP